LPNKINLMKISKNIFTNKKVLLLVIFLATVGLALSLASHFSLAAPTNIEFKNPVGTPSLTDFLQNVMVKLGSIIAFLATLALVIGGVMYILSATGGGNETMKKLAQQTITFAIIGLALAVAGPAFLKEIKVIVLGGENAPMPTNIGQAPSVAEIVGRALQFLLSIVGILAIIGLVIGGIMYLLAGTVDVAERAGKTIKYSIVGMIATGMSLIIVKKIVELITQ